jgi:hypothetical protein
MREYVRPPEAGGSPARDNRRPKLRPRYLCRTYFVVVRTTFEVSFAQRLVVVFHIESPTSRYTNRLLVVVAVAGFFACS